MNREKLGEQAYLAKIGTQQETIDGLTAQLKEADEERDRLNRALHLKDMVIGELQWRVEFYRRVRRVEWLKLFVLMVVAHFVWALIATL